MTHRRTIRCFGLLDLAHDMAENANHWGWPVVMAALLLIVGAA